MRPRIASLVLLSPLLLVACGSDSEAYLEHCKPAPDFVAGEGPAFPPRSERHAAKAVAVVRNDPTVQRLIGRRGFTSPRQIPWHSGEATGYVVTMKFEESFSVGSEEWPVVIYPGAGRPDANETPRLLCKQGVETTYITNINKGVEATDVTFLSATVNLRSEEVEELGFFDPSVPASHDAQVEYEDIGSLPEEYESVPGY